MFNAKKILPRMIYFIISIYFMELILRLSVAGDNGFVSVVLLNSLIFSIILGLIIFLISSLFQRRLNFIVSLVLLLLTGLLFTSQFLYYKFFRTFYSFYSAGNANQILDFRQDIWTVISNNYLWLILFLLPALFILFVGGKIFNFDRIRLLNKGLIIALIIIFHITGLTSIWLSGQDQNSAYDLYFQIRDPILSVDRLGLYTTMRLDLQRLATGWSPTLHAPEMPVYEPEPIDEVVYDDEAVETIEADDDSEDVDMDEEVEKAEKIIEYNTLDIDFETLISNETNDSIKQMHNYFSSLEPSAKNDYTGKFEGYNVIFITAESFAPYAIDQEVTPTLYKMVNEGYDFTDFYVPLWDVSSSDGEYVSLTSLIPKSGIWSFSASSGIELPYVMGNHLKGAGYNTVAYHNHSYTYYNRDQSHPNMGYKYTGIGNGLNISGGWPRSDFEMMQATVPQYIDTEPFHAYYVTVSGHMQYSFAGNNIAYKNRQYVNNLPYSEEAKAYLATQIELDKAMEDMLAQLEAADLADRTLIVLATDHYPYGLENSTIEELSGQRVESDFDLYKSSLIMYSKDMDPVKIDKPSSNLDITPTLYNLLGVDYDSRLFMGSDIFSDSDPLVMFRNKSFITDRGTYDSTTQNFIPSNESNVHEEYVDALSLIVENKFYYSAKILETDYYSRLK